MTKILIFCLLILMPDILGSQDIKPFATAIYVKNLEISTQWYENVFNVKSYKSLSYPEYGTFRIELLGNDNLRFELVERDNSFSIRDLDPDYDIREMPLRGYYKIAFETEDIESLYNKLKSNKVEFHWELNRDDELGIKTFIIKDPDENLIQFIERI